MEGIVVLILVALVRGHIFFAKKLKAESQHPAEANVRIWETFLQCSATSLQLQGNTIGHALVNIYSPVLQTDELEQWHYIFYVYRLSIYSSSSV